MRENNSHIDARTWVQCYSKLTHMTHETWVQAHIFFGWHLKWCVRLSIWTSELSTFNSIQNFGIGKLQSVQKLYRKYDKWYRLKKNIQLDSTKYCPSCLGDMCCASIQPEAKGVQGKHSRWLVLLLGQWKPWLRWRSCRRSNGAQPNSVAKPESEKMQAQPNLGVWVCGVWYRYRLLLLLCYIMIYDLYFFMKV